MVKSEKGKRTPPQPSPPMRVHIEQAERELASPRLQGDCLASPRLRGDCLASPRLRGD